MAILLERLYEEICNDYDVKLLTTSCFDKKIDWMHMVEIGEFAYLLHGEELVFNSGVNFDSEEWLKDFIDELIPMQAGGLIISTKDINMFSPEIIDYCNRIHFPLFWASWQTSFLEIMRKFSEILLNTEQNDSLLITALKNAIYYPSDDSVYLPHFERNGFFENMTYTVSIIDLSSEITNSTKEVLENFKKPLRFIAKKSIVYEEQNRLIILTCDYSPSHLKNIFKSVYNKDETFHIGIGTCEPGLKSIYQSYQNALISFQLSHNSSFKNLLCYDDLGIYKLLTDMKNPDLGMKFAHNTLGRLVDYDKENSSNFVELLEHFFENDCNLLQTADVLFFHKNTLKYKMNKIQEILGYDIKSNENRLNIMISLAILRLNEVFS